MTESKEQKYESFLMLYKANESRIFRFILALLPNYSAAEDIMQDTMLVMWREYDHYESGTSFAAWGMQIARFAVLQFHRKSRTGIVHFDTNTLDKIMEHEMVLKEDEGPYTKALEECTKKLQENGKKIISMRYIDNMKIIDIALKMEKSLDSTYKVISRIHHSLQNCIERRMAEKETA